MALDTPINRKSLISVFPDLANDVNFKILSDCTPVYNCIAWAMGYTDRWVSTETEAGPWIWWPPKAVKAHTPDALIDAFKVVGFELCEDCMPEEGYSKVVLYKKADAEEWTHASRIVASGIEHSKFGSSWDGEHSHDVLCKTTSGQESLSYGIAYAYMKRKATTIPASYLDGNMTVDQGNLQKLKAQLEK